MVESRYWVLVLGISVSISINISISISIEVGIGSRYWGYLLGTGKHPNIPLPNTTTTTTTSTTTTTIPSTEHTSTFYLSLFVVGRAFFRINLLKYICIYVYIYIYIYIRKAEKKRKDFFNILRNLCQILKKCYM